MTKEANKAYGASISNSLEEFKSALRAHANLLYKKNFFVNEAAYQKALDNIESITQADYEAQEGQREGISSLN